MTYLEAFKAIKKAIKPGAGSGVEGNLALQVNLTDADCNGIFYIAVLDGVAQVEPYDYRDNDAILYTDYGTMHEIVTAKLGVAKAIDSGKVVVEGSTQRALELQQLVKKAVAKKTPTKAATTVKKAETAKKEPKKTIKKLLEKPTK